MDIAFDRRFIQSTQALTPIEAQRVWKAFDRYSDDPNHRSLNLELLDGRAGKNRLWSIRASDELRILLARQGSLTIFLRAGHHDDIYELAEHSAFVVPRSGAPGLIGLSRTDFRTDSGHRSEDLRDTAEADRLPSVTGDGDYRQTILEDWSNSDLIEAGFAQDEIDILRSATADDLLDRWPNIDEETLTKVLELSEVSPEDWRQRRLLEDEEADNARFRRAVVERGPLAGLSSVLSPDEVRRLAAAPIEDWMIFLHPDQRPLIDRRYNGPARVRGSAGTGKTVVALHRAAALAKRYATEEVDRTSMRRTILFTTYVKHLPTVFANLYRRLPTATRGAVEFVNIDKLAMRICREAGLRMNPDRRKLDSTFSKACRAVIRSGTPLQRAGLSYGYLREEITAVMKGRGVSSVDEYLGMERTGRKTPFTPAMRNQAWELRDEWDHRLSETGAVDFADIVLTALDLARGRSSPMYRAAVIDEAQDFTLVGLQLVRTLVNAPAETDQPDGLFIVGDGAQKIYPGGFTLAQAGVDVRGNSSVLRVNYRNSRRTIAAAMACTGDETVNDLGHEYARGEAEAETLREGVKPTLVSAEYLGAQIAWVAEEIKRLCEGGIVRPGDIAVCGSTNRLVDQVLAELTRAGMQCQKLADFEGRSNDYIKVGTFHRIKGLEFKIVFILDISAGRFPSPRFRGQSESEHIDRRTLQISELFVAMTRARDRLFVLCTQEPSDVLKLDSFELEMA